VVVGVLTLRSPAAEEMAGFKEELAARGWKADAQLVIEEVHAGGEADRLPKLAQALAAKKPAVIVATGSSRVARAAANAAPGTPIVIAFISDPVSRGLAKTLARPGGQFTGVSTAGVETVVKFVELLKTVMPALRAAQDLAPLGINAAVVNARFVKPLDTELLSSLLTRVPRLLTVEDHVISAGFGSAVIEFLADADINGVEIRRLGVPDRFIPHGTQDELRKMCGFDKDAIAQAVLQMVRRRKKRSREGWERGSA